MTIPPIPSPPLRPRRKKRVIGFSIFLIFLCVSCYLFYWFLLAQFYEKTKDAYVNGNMITISSLEEGLVTAIFTDDTLLVEQGQVLLELDRKNQLIRLAKTQETLADKVRFVTQQFIKVEELEARHEMKEADLLKASEDYEHRQALVGSGSVSLEDFQHAQAAFLAAYGAVLEVKKQLEAARVFVENTQIENHPQVEEAKSQVRSAFLSLHRCTVIAPTKGIITQRKVQLGEWVRSDTPLMALIPLEQIWVDANFREVDLKHVRIGQPVTLTSELYGNQVKFQGCVVGINPGTGSVFSILPPQNASGNWIKIIQRIPVKIALVKEEVLKHPLVLGLSMTVKVDTHQREGLQLPQMSYNCPIYESFAYEDELAGVEELIEQIIVENQFYVSSDSL